MTQCQQHAAQQEREQHTPEPWRLNSAGSGKNGKFEIDEYYIYAPSTCDDVAIASSVIDPITCKPSEANARRIVACVNACTRYSDEELANGDLWQRSHYQSNTIAELTKQRNELLVALDAAAKSLETISVNAGINELMNSMSQVACYARSRAGVSIEAIASVKGGV